MNRPGQASDPSMEDILASIRRIISDDEQRDPAEGMGREREDYQPADLSRRAVPAPVEMELSEDEVLDLTSELVFADEEPQEAEPLILGDAAADAQEPESTTIRSNEFQRPQERVSPPPPATREKPFSPQAAPGQAASAGNARPEIRQPAPRSAPPPSRPIWSRRELPNQSGSSGASSRGRTENPQIAEKPFPQPQAAWVEDIQIPVPDQGPISLMGSPEPQATYDRSTGASAGRDSATVAALAHTLAKSAVVALEDDELVEARDVNFENIDASHRADVSEKFADAMHIEAEEEPVQQTSSFLQPGLLDEVLRNEFIREAPPQSEDEEDDPLALSELPASHAAGYSPAPDSWAAGGMRAQEWRQGSEGVGRIEQPDIQRSTVETPMHRTIAQAQFTGADLAPPPVVSGRSLEDSVREMLRPLLMQWLNENMPRIIESAIREEIAQRGLLPKMGGGQN